MADKMSLEEVVEAMYNIVADSMGKKKIKPNELPKLLIAQYGEDMVDKNNAREAIRVLIDSGRCVYSYFGGTFVELPHKEGAANE